MPRARLGAQRGGHRRVLGRVGPLLRTRPDWPNCWICTGTVADRVWLAAARLSEECSPNAKITAVAPNAIAASDTRVRAGRANGAARPRPTGRGRRSRAASRCATYPRPAAGARPAAIACRGGQPAGAQRGPERGQRRQRDHPGRGGTEAHHGTCWLPTP